MSVKLIDKLSQENLCTYFVLPFIGLNKLSFLSGNFIDSYIVRPKYRIVPGGRFERGFTYIMVEFITPMLISPRFIKNHPCYTIDGVDDVTKNMFVLYYIPPKWEADVDLFMEGKFSKMSTAAIEVIRSYSGLPYQSRTSIFGTSMFTVETDFRLLAFEKHTELRQMWERELLVTLTEKSELLSIPGEKSYKEYP